MKLVKKLLNKINGLHHKQEYLCLAKESFQQPLHAYLIHNGQRVKDITNLHLFVGYSPVIFAFSSSLSGINPAQQTIRVAFSDKELIPNETFSEKDAVAILSLKKIHQEMAGGDEIIFYEGTEGRHHFVSKFHQLISQLNNELYNKKPGNVFLAGNLYKQMAIAYALPRTISLVTVGQGQLFNHFPSDLHGKINDQYYIISLRYEGKACQQVEAAGQLVISNMQPFAYKKVYSLGKNHMQPLKDRSVFDFDPATSRNFQLPLPRDPQSYKELKLETSFIYGIHKLLVFKIVHEEKISESATLAHIHNCYAEWRYKQGKSSNYLLR